MVNANDKDTLSRERRIFAVTLKGSVINFLLVLFKLAAGILGHSAAMIADGIHSLSDLATDAVVIVMVRLSSRPEDSDHDYGHGKYETLATAIIGLALLAVGVGICVKGVTDIYHAVTGTPLRQPAYVALVAAVVSVVMKEWAFRFTARVARQLNSSSLMANAWHHRSDALSSIGTMAGIGGAILLGPSWAVLDPIAAVVVSLLIMHTSFDLIGRSIDELLEKSLPQDVEDKIISIATADPEVSGVHHLRTRRIGHNIAIEMHVRMPGDISLYEAHAHASGIEHRLYDCFGPGTHIGIHVEPLKDAKDAAKEAKPQ